MLITLIMEAINMATAGMLQRVHTIKSDEVEQLVEAFEASEKWWEENVKGKPKIKNFRTLTDGKDIDNLIANYKWE